MVTTQSPIGASVHRPAEHELGRLAAWCCDHWRRTLASWLPARFRLKQPDLVVSLIATQILGVVMARYVARTEPLASPSMARLGGGCPRSGLASFAQWHRQHL
jgi:Tetracyclin repressor-like, C-terminal domain